MLRGAKRHEAKEGKLADFLILRTKKMREKKFRRLGGESLRHPDVFRKGG